MDKVSGKHSSLSSTVHHGIRCFRPNDSCPPSVLHCPQPYQYQPQKTNISYLRPEHVKRSHTLRYVLKDIGTDKLLFCVLFTLYLKEDVDEEGNLKEGVLGGKPLSLMTEAEKKQHQEQVEKVASGKENVKDDGVKKDEDVKKEKVETNEDDLD
jgi:hypothetical protein